MWSSTTPSWFLLYILLLTFISPSFEACSWTDKQTKTALGSYQLYPKLGTDDDCKAKCEADTPKCKAIYNIDGSVCQLFDKHIPPASLTDNSNAGYYELTCQQVEECMEVTNGVKPLSSSTVTVKLKDAESLCKQMCLAIKECTAISYSSTQCLIFTADRVFIASDTAFIHIEKDSSGCAFKGSSPDMKGTSQPAFTMELTVDSCKTACEKASNCKSVAYNQNDMECVFYENPSDTEVSTKYTLYKKSSSCETGTVTVVRCGSATNAPSKLFIVWVVLILIFTLL